MKIFLIIFFTSTLQLKAASLLAQKITLKESKAKLSDIIDQIAKQSGYDFAYNEKLIDQIQGINITLKDASVEQALRMALANLPLTYELEDNFVVIKSIPSNPISSPRIQRDSLMTGTVLDANTKQPIPGVTVTVKGTKLSASTNKDGKFSIAIATGAKLTFTCIGYKMAERSVRVSEALTILLEATIQEIEATIVTGYVERKIETYTGAQKQIDGEQIREISNTNVLTAIQAIDPSFRIVADNIIGSDINATPEIQVRGANGFPNLTGELSSNPNTPLFVLDGFDSDLRTILDLDINLIDKVTILKDASATSIYGSRGANGVVIVTTKVPVPGKIQVSFSNTVVYSAPDLSVYNLLNAREKLDLEQRSGIYFRGSAGSTVLSDQGLYFERYKNMAAGVDTDWKKIAVQDGFSNNASLNLSGGDQAIRYQLNFNGNPQTGVMKGQDRTNLNGQFTLSYNRKKVRFSNQIAVGRITANNSPYGSFSQYLTLNPYWSPYDGSGETPKYLENLNLGGAVAVINPVYNANLHSVDESKSFNVRNNFTFEYQPVHNARVTTTLGLSQEKGNTNVFRSALDTRFDGITNLGEKGSYVAGNSNSSSLQSRSTAFINLLYGPHQLNPSINLTINSTSRDAQTITATGFPYDRLDNLLFAAQYQANGKPSGSEDTQNSLGYGGTLGYTYDQRYTIEGNINREGSSAYGNLSRWGTFWSVGGLWNLHNESFFQNSQFLDQLRFRATYGYTGSAGRDPYASQFMYNFGVNTQYYGELGATPANLGNPRLGWQTVRKVNLGLNFAMLNNKLNGSVDAYRENTENAINALSLAPSVGFASIQDNIGKIQNLGMQVDIRYNLVNKQNIFWSVGFNGAANRNKLLEFSARYQAINDLLEARSDANRQTAPNPQLQEGQSITALYVVPSLGIDPITGAEIFVKRDGTRTFTYSPGDKIAVGDTNPDWTGSIHTNFRFKGFELGLVFGYQFGAEIFNSTLMNRVENVNAANNVDRRAYELGWTAPGDVSQYRRIARVTSFSPVTPASTRFVQRDNQLDITSLNLTYNFGRYNQEFLKNLGLENLSLSAQTNNLANFRTVAMERGTDNPFARVYNFSISARF